MKQLSVCLALLLASCAPSPNRIPGPSAQVTRDEAIAIAKSYQQVMWTPTKANLLHAKDPDGVTVHTPDASLTQHGYKNGWWLPDQAMRGVPYQWGGFDTPMEFLKKLKQGHAAGDIATPEKRRLDDAAVSRYACGIDCSGFISRCWRLERAHSTDEFHRICTPLESPQELRPGDIMLSDRHVLMFSDWDLFNDNHLVVYESTPNPTWRVNIGSIPLERLIKDGYRPWRYRNITD